MSSVGKKWICVNIQAWKRNVYSLETWIAIISPKSFNFNSKCQKSKSTSCIIENIVRYSHISIILYRKIAIILTWQIVIWIEILKYNFVLIVLISDLSRVKNNQNLGNSIIHYIQSLLWNIIIIWVNISRCNFLELIIWVLNSRDITEFAVSTVASCQRNAWARIR